MVSTCVSLSVHEKQPKAPFIFLSEDASVASKVKGLELGADDYLVRPIYIKDLLSRIEILMANVHRGLVSRTDVSTDIMRGDLSKISLVEVIQAMAAGRKDATARLDGPNARGHIWFHQGQVIDTSVDGLQGEAALPCSMGSGHLKSTLKRLRGSWQSRDQFRNSFTKRLTVFWEQLRATPASEYDLCSQL